MAKPLDLHGLTFGKLTVLSRAKNTKAGKAQWFCTCECGGTTTVASATLKRCDIKSCGCLQREAITKLGRSLLDDLSGKVFGRLTVIARGANTRGGKPGWICMCTCGNKTTVAAQNLRGGATTSCGCYRTEEMARRATTHGLSRTYEYRRALAKSRYVRRSGDVVWGLALRIRDLMRKSIAVRGYRKATRTHEILGCDYDFFRKHIESLFTDGMSWERFGEIHLDHIRPMATAVTETDVLRLSHYTNMQPLWAKDNLEKGASLTWKKDAAASFLHGKVGEIVISPQMCESQ